jgi:hypothetical protein
VEGPFVPGAPLLGVAQLLITGRTELRDFEWPEMEVSPTRWRFAFREDATDALRDLAKRPRD